MKRMTLLSAVAATALALASPANANIFIDEDFEDGVAWDGSGSGTTGGAVNNFNDNGTSDGADDGTVAAPITVTPTGSPVIAGPGSPQSPSMAYVVPSGSSFTVTPAGGFTGDVGGPLQYIQCNLTCDSTGAGVGVVVARMDIPWGGGTPANFYVELVSDGAGGADVRVGEDGGTLAGFGPTSIGTPITAAGDWRLVTIGINKNFSGGGGSDEPDPTLGIVVPEGTALFWSASPAGTPDATYGFGAALVGSTGLSFATVAGTDAVIDDVYWEGAMTDGSLITIFAATNEPNRLILAPSLPVELDAFDIE